MHYDYFVIGAGSGGVRSARIAAQLGAKVGVAEESALGGTCVNAGCIPKKLFMYGGRYGMAAEDARGYGWDIDIKGFSWKTLVANKDLEIGRLNGIYERLMVNAGCELHRGRAHFIDAHTVEVNGERHTADNFLIATGGWPRLPTIQSAQPHVMTSNDVFHLPEAPRELAVVGGGYIALEFASFFNEIGTKVTVIHRGSLPLRGFDRELRQRLYDELSRAGVNFQLSATLDHIEEVDGRKELQLSNGTTLQADEILCAIGRVPNTAPLNLDAAGVKIDDNGAVVVNERWQSSQPHIYALGDVIDRVALTPVAIAEGHALALQLFDEKMRHVNYQNIPTAVFTTPEVGTVGMSEEDAIEAGHDVTVFTSDFKPMRHQLTGRETRSLMKVVVDASTDRVLGCHMVGEDAAEIIQPLAIALNMGATKADFDRTIALHPSSSEEFVLMRTPRV